MKVLSEEDACRDLVIARCVGFVGTDNEFENRCWFLRGPRLEIEPASLKFAGEDRLKWECMGSTCKLHETAAIRPWMGWRGGVAKFLGNAVTKDFQKNLKFSTAVLW